MDPKKNFTQQDKEMVTKYLNLVAKSATFEHKTNELIDYFKHLSYMQQTLLPKIEANIFEVLTVKDDSLDEGNISSGEGSE